MPESIADHIWNSLTFGTSLFDLVGKDWAQRWPVVKYAWPRAWDERRAAKHKATDGSSDVEDILMTDLTDSLRTVKDILTQAERVLSNLTEREERLRVREEKCAAREERLSKAEADLQQGGQVLNELEDVADSLKASEEALRTCHGQLIRQDRATRNFASNARRIQDR